MHSVRPLGLLPARMVSDYHRGSYIATDIRRGKLNSQFIVTVPAHGFSDFRSNTVNIQAWAAPSRAL